MPGRYYIAPIMGSGRIGDGYRASTCDLGFDHSAVIPTGPAGPLFDWALVCAQDRIDADDHLPFPADLRMPWSEAADGPALLAAIKARFGLTYAASAGDTVGDVVAALRDALLASGA